MQIEIAFARISEKQKAFINTVILYNRTYKKVPIPIWQKVKRGDRFVIQYVNPKYEEVFGDVFGNDVRNIIGSDNFELGYTYERAKRYYDTDMNKKKLRDKKSESENMFPEEGNAVDNEMIVSLRIILAHHPVLVTQTLERSVIIKDSFTYQKHL